MKKDTGFTPVAFAEEQLEQGLTSYPDDEMPWTCVTIFAWEPTEFERTLGIRFHDSFDSLDYVKVAALDMPSGTRVTLRRHRGSPGPGTELCIPEKELGRYPSIEAEVMDALGLRPDDIIWSRPRDHR